jgi:hypothetical protein
MRCVKAPVEQCLHGTMFGGVAGGFVLPVMPYDPAPGAGEDARGVGRVVSWGSGAVVQVGAPRGCFGDPSKFTDTRMVYQ